MRIFLAIIGAILLTITIGIILASRVPNTGSTPVASDSNANPAPVTPPSSLTDFDHVKQGAVQATLEIEGRGTMTLELYPKAAPKTVEHFVDLCKKHFYEGILVHRVEPSFVFQAGDPESKNVPADQLRGKTSSEVSQQFHLGGGGSGATVPLEATLPHSIYSVGLARSEDPNSGDSQFYVNLKDNPMLDGKYCVFGRVIKGQEIATKVQIGDKIKRLSVP